MRRASFEACGNRLADVLQGLGFRLSLGHAARDGGTLGDDHACLVGLQGYQELHAHYCTRTEKRRSGRGYSALSASTLT
jgi:hypothetical protein